MIFLPFLHFFSFIACIFLAIFVFYKDRQSLLNRTCAVLMLCYALWNFGDIIVHNTDSSITRDTVIIIQNIASVGWISFASVIFYFSLVFSRNEKLLKKKWLLLIISVLPVLFLYKQFTNCLTINPVRQSYGWSVEWSDSIWSLMFFTYYTIFISLAVIIVYFYGRKTKIINEKKQSKIIVNTFTVGILAGTLLDVLLQKLGFYGIPPVANLLAFIFASGVLYAMYKYTFLTITPTIAAENIVSAMDEILILLNHEGDILTANKAALDTLQYEQKELTGKPFSMLYHEESIKNEPVGKILREDPVSNKESTILAKTGKPVPVIYSSSPVKDNSGTMIGTVFIARDITLRKQIEDELIISKEKAEESDRLKTSFLANMSHEIRTPMNGILGFAELLKDPTLTGEQHLEYIELIQRGGARMLNIINDIIDISKIEAGLVEVNLKKSDINEVLEYIYTFFKPETDAKGMKFSYKSNLSAEEAMVVTDREKVFAILTNLIKNSIKYSDKGSIEFGCEKIKKHLFSSLQFYVKDTGIGIPEERQEAIFERFIQADIANKMARQGAGLGLSITRAYVEMLGGAIWVESEENKGSTFYFIIPCSTELTEEATSKVKMTPLKEFSDSKKLKILIAEDDEASKILISTFVKEVSNRLIEARSGKEIVELCRMNPDFDLILMDIQMPELNGYEATRQIRQFNKDIVIIAQTALAQTGDREKAIEAGCNGYIAKPISKNALLELMFNHFKN